MDNINKFSSVTAFESVVLLDKRLFFRWNTFHFISTFNCKRQTSLSWFVFLNFSCFTLSFLRISSSFRLRFPRGHFAIMFTKTHLTNIAVAGFQVVSGIAGYSLKNNLSAGKKSFFTPVWHTKQQATVGQVINYNSHDIAYNKNE